MSAEDRRVSASLRGAAGRGRDALQRGEQRARQCARASMRRQRRGGQARVLMPVQADRVPTTEYSRGQATQGLYGGKDRGAQLLNGTDEGRCHPNVAPQATFSGVCSY